MTVEPRIRNGICMTAHPKGCALAVQKEIDYVKSQPKFNGAKKVLVVGGSTGYGLSSRISLAFGSGAGTLNISFEKEGSEKRPATPGFYNNRAFDEKAKAEGLIAESINADAFSHETRKIAIERIKELFGKVDMIVYSLASPVRPDPDTGELYKSCLKPLGETYTAKSVNPEKGTVTEVSIEPADESEIAPTVKVMGGEDWMLWIKALKEADVLEDGFKSIAYSYIGPELTMAVYRKGTIGKAKEHLEATAKEITEFTKDINGQAWVSVNKALVTRSSSVIPVVPLYISLLFKIMKEKEIHEGCIEQMQRMFVQKIYNGSTAIVDEEGRLRLDDLEMRDDVQAEVEKRWDSITSDTLSEMTDIETYKSDFLKLHGFGFDEIDYTEDVDFL
ncbi:trans-2-enoyl-CoA reductase family protein [Thiospirochaeta perfilievii]|uniref:Trans-2-enoyl-CoA reductase [NADH] n=1 Tax=Thiospirochaeta perfilievii TaxID=252967 RepID=A0A5C1QA29_9SPIO|nr:enoyl-ACP reductase FabV [Thiospirochaeta perfilievii]QEN03769.1 trans-2-enoyl-CoA reductase family protein [Thiospirochaeta perfilievii]